MTADSPIIPTSADLSLEETVARLRSNPRVRAVMFLGSTGTAELTDASDYDLLLLLADYTGFAIEVSLIDQRIADLVVISADAAERLGLGPEQRADSAEPDAARVAEQEWPFVHWLAEARPVYDSDGIGQVLHERAVVLARAQPPISTAKQRVTRSFISHDLRVNSALLRRLEDPITRTALGMRQLHTFVSVVQAWFTARDVRPQGWKKNLQHLADADPDFLRLIEQWLATSDLTDRHTLFEQAAQRALEPLGGPLPYDAFAPGEDSVWEELLSGGP